MTICIRQFPCSLCYIELSSLYLKVAKRHENNINFNISLKKNTTTFKFAHGLPVAVFYAMVLANKIFSKRKYFFLNLQTSKYTLFLEVCKFEKILPVGTRLDISLKKIPRPSNLHTIYLSRYSMRWFLPKKYFPNGSIFFPIFKLLNKMVYLDVCKLEKKYFRLENIFFANTIA